MRRRALLLLLLLSLLALSSSARPHLLFITNDHVKSSPPSPFDTPDPADDSPEWAEFGDPDPSAGDALDPGSWAAILDPPSPHPHPNSTDPRVSLYFSGVSALISASVSGDRDEIAAAASEIEAATSAGLPHAQSVLAFLYSTGTARPQSRSKAFLHHHFAADGGNMQSKMVLAYNYLRQEMTEKAVKLYAELAEAAVASFLLSKEPAVIEPVRIHSGTEENKDALRKSRGEEDEDFQVSEYQAQKGNAASMYMIGILYYYYGLRGMRRDYGKAFSWFSKAVEKVEGLREGV